MPPARRDRAKSPAAQRSPARPQAANGGRRRVQQLQQMPCRNISTIQRRANKRRALRQRSTAKTDRDLAKSVSTHGPSLKEHNRRLLTALGKDMKVSDAESNPSRRAAVSMGKTNLGEPDIEVDRAGHEEQTSPASLRPRRVWPSCLRNWWQSANTEEDCNVVTATMRAVQPAIVPHQRRARKFGKARETASKTWRLPSNIRSKH